jgi:hypothetical protein
MTKLKDIEAAQDEMWCDLADIKTMLEIINKRLDRRDEINRQLVAHTERLVKDKEHLLRMIGVMVAIRQN